MLYPFRKKSGSFTFNVGLKGYQFGREMGFLTASDAVGKRNE
ncbi:hypothetical protein VCHA34P112_50161 [Vibrio chagasii]|nr:hypothetical protein VCHA34P112_50161 [Vibrio chagasii]CAH7235515.1 hypothetical protein VCHA53O464_10187 [Vibrio chagasii]CAH7384518.1 hypothetical protein VCHA56P515_60156 [Vibrio chagasii]CAH7426212.1 hypothetical protein VCHA53O463_60082 [Vibrio chagasii]